MAASRSEIEPARLPKVQKSILGQSPTSYCFRADCKKAHSDITPNRLSGLRVQSLIPCLGQSLDGFLERLNPLIQADFISGHRDHRARGERAFDLGSPDGGRPVPLLAPVRLHLVAGGTVVGDESE